MPRPSTAPHRCTSPDEGGGCVRAKALLTEHGAALELAKDDGDAALHLAAKGGHARITELLLERCSDATHAIAF